MAQDLSQALVFYQMQQEPGHLRALLRKGGPEAGWVWAERVEEAFRRSPAVQDLDEAELALEFYRTWTPGEEERDPPSPKERLSKLEISRIMSATEKLMPPGLYEALTQGPTTMSERAV